MHERFVGIDVGAETIKVVELHRVGEHLHWERRLLVEHNKEPGAKLLEILGALDWTGVKGAAVSGRLGRQVNLTRVPAKQALAEGFRFLHGAEPATIVSIGSHGFSVLELRGAGVELFRENSRCSQGTGNFLRQLVERFDVTIEGASALAAPVAESAPLSGRCPVILKTDMTHLANKGEDRARILAGLFDAVCENVQVLVKPRSSPPRVLLSGGVSRAPRVQDHFRRFLGRHDMTLLGSRGDDALFIEALGSAIIAAGRPAGVPALDHLMHPTHDSQLERLPPLSAALPQVTRMPAPPKVTLGEETRDLILGFDIGSTGSKAVAVDVGTREVVWEGYLKTNGDPVGAAQALMRRFTEGPAQRYPVRALAATGSGREVVGSLLTTCYGGETVFVLNEIAAHAAGALHYDDQVDTIFEIGGQDAKYIRLCEGRVIDAAMNEACSAGTGSFIEEQGKKFGGIADVVQLGDEALSSPCGVSLGQHCSVFMAEIIDEAVAGGVEQQAIIAGIYDSIIQNYLNRVKGARSVGQRIFCQGMPFSADALAAAVARQTGSRVIIPPNPGNIGALGIALLALREIDVAARPALDPARFLAAHVERKDTFICKATQGCGGAGNHCRIDRLSTRVMDERKKFTWGGGCSLWDKGTRRQKLPDRAPDPFREREELVAEIIARVSAPRGRHRVAMTDEFQLKGLFPFFATFLRELGLDPVVRTGADHALLKRGIEEANVPFCAPMQQYHGVVSSLARDEHPPDYLFLPMMRSLPRSAGERTANVCPIVQGSTEMLRADLGEPLGSRILSPVIDIGAGNLDSKEFFQSCERLADELGASGDLILPAFREARRVQDEFDERTQALGQAALDFCADKGLTPVIVLGRPYTIYNTVLNSNVPAILREQGVIAIPVDCYPVAAAVPVFDDMYWGHGQRNLRAAHQIRRTPGIYSLYCSNYSCGPDSFTLHFYSYIMEGKPFAIIETDGHSGDAGTKTRVEAFLHCVREDLSGRSAPRRPTSFKLIELDKEGLRDVLRRDERLLVPRMGPGAPAVAACLRGVGVRAEAMDPPDVESVRIGRRYTSGKECVPMTLSLGNLLQRLEKDRDSDERFAYLMPTASGPCRFGVYNLLHKITLERLGWKDRVRIWSPPDDDYFAGVPKGFSALVFTALMSIDLLQDALYDVRPVETRRGAANAIFERYQEELHLMLEREAAGDLDVPSALMQVASGRLFGCADLLRRAAREFKAIKGPTHPPTVLLVGEIYVRCEAFANDFVVEKLEQRGLRVRFAPFNEWLEYTDLINWRDGKRSGAAATVASLVQARVQESTYHIVGEILGWPARTTVQQSMKAAEGYVRPELNGEAVLTVGGPVHEWREGHIDGVVSVGPLECMPNKIAESQFFHVAQREGLLSLTLPLNGDPIDPEVLDNFAFEVHARSRRGEGRMFVDKDAFLKRSVKRLTGLGRRALHLNVLSAR